MPAPVIAGVAQVANRDDDRIAHPAELMAEAAAAALADAGVTPHQVDGVLSTPMSLFDTVSGAELVAAALELPPGVRGESAYSGAGPQRLVQQACRAVAEGSARAVLVVGGIADASVRRARRLGVEPPAPPTAMWSQGSDGTADLTPSDPGRIGSCAEVTSGAVMPTHFFALVESSLHAGLDRATHRERLGRLMAPFTEAAARRPDLAWFPTVRSAAEIATPSAGNRLIAEPYTKLMCSFPTVDLAAAVVITRADLAAGAGADRALTPVAVTTVKDALAPSARPVIHRSIALEQAVDRAMALAGVTPDDIDAFDLYSCFPAAVQLLSGGLGLADDDRRPRSVAGGLPYFGGPGASYSLHALVCMAEELRARPATLGAVVGLGGLVNDFAVGVYTTAEGPHATDDLGEVTDNAVALATEASGTAVVEAMTVAHARDAGPVAAPLIARLPDGRRVGARAGSEDLPSKLAGTNLVGQEVHLDTINGEVQFQLLS